MRSRVRSAERVDADGNERARGRAWLLLCLPALLVLVVVFVLPVAHLAAKSLHLDAGLGQVGPELTLANYVKFFADPFYLYILLDTFELGFIVVTICLVLGYPVAYFLARTRSRWRGIFLFLVVAPLLISVVIRNLGWLPVLGDNGLVNWALTGIGLIRKPLRLVNNFTGVVIGLVHTLLPFMILTLTTVIQRIEPDIEEAAINLGASPFETFWRVVFPLSRPGLLSGYLLVFTMAISAYTTPALLGGKRVLVMATYIDQQVRTVLDYALGATVAVILMLVAGAVTVVALRQDARRSPP
jgi:putative spermidine/putrescine transport system permease protein